MTPRKSVSARQHKQNEAIHTLHDFTPHARGGGIDGFAPRYVGSFVDGYGRLSAEGVSIVDIARDLYRFGVCNCLGCRIDGIVQCEYGSIGCRLRNACGFNSSSGGILDKEIPRRGL